VAGRFVEAASSRALDALVRISGDSPLLDPALVDLALERFRSGGADVVTNVRPRTFPPGQSVEVVATAALADAHASMTEEREREHVTPFLYEHPDRYRIDAFRADRDYGDLRLVVDTPEDLASFAAILHRMRRPHWDYGLDEIADLARQAA
jgi:spore coat polysaccharide biosynthesis protein SpsF (cytidylyltransferase family)